MTFLKITLYTSLLSLICIGCNKTDSQQSANENSDHPDNRVVLTDAQMRTAGIRFGKVEEKQISGNIKVNGVLDVPPQQLVSISAPLGGFLKDTKLLQGSKVKKGQLIAVIENLDFVQIQQDYLEAKGNFELAAHDYQRQQDLAKENVNSQKALQQSKANHTTWSARYLGLLEKLRVLNLNPSSVEGGNLKSSINLYSPIDGYVTHVNVNIGRFVNSTDVLFEIVDTEHLHAELIVFEKDVPKLKLGQKVRFTLANETTERIATVYLIGRAIGEDRTIQIHCHIDKEDTELLPGMYLSAVVETGNVLTPAVPDNAVIDYLGSKYLFVAADSLSVTGKPPATNTTFDMVEIQTGNSEFGYTEVTLPERFPHDARLVVNGAYSLLSKLKNSGEED